MSTVDYLDELIARRVLVTDGGLDQHSEQRWPSAAGQAADERQSDADARVSTDHDPHRIH
jgi:hypothetical protein